MWKNSLKILPILLAFSTGAESQLISRIDRIRPIQPVVRDFLLDKTPRITVGKWKNILPPLHKLPLFQFENPIVHPMINMYQLDQRYADLFSPSGTSMICGATAMANALVYLRHNHLPKYPRILEDSLTSSATNEDVVRALFDLCNTNPSNGTLVSDMLNCAKTALQEGNYLTTQTYIRGIHTGDNANRLPPAPSDLFTQSRSTYQQGDSPNESDKGVVLLLGWYQKNWRADLNKFEYQRVGGHYVTLAGYNGNEAEYLQNKTNKEYIFYVSNPLVDYNASGNNIRYSKVSFKAVSGDVVLPAGFRQGQFQSWETSDLVGGALAVLEDMVIILPQPMRAFDVLRPGIINLR